MPKERRVELRVTEAEWLRWKEAAWTARMTLAEWIRSRCSAGPVIDPVPPVQSAPNGKPKLEHKTPHAPPVPPKTFTLAQLRQIREKGE